MTPANNADLCEWVVFLFPFPTLDNRSFFSFPIEPGLDSEARRPHRDSLPQTSNNVCVGAALSNRVHTFFHPLENGPLEPE